jgi:hypothetical protein
MQNVRDSNPTGTAYTDKKENQILLIYKEIQNGAGGDGVVEEAAAVTAVPGTAIPCTL